MKSGKKLKICFVLGIDPSFDGGMGLYQRNLLESIKSQNKNYELSVVYFGKENKKFLKENVKYVELKSIFPYPLDQIMENLKLASFLKNNNFDVINAHAIFGAWMQFYKKKKNQILVNTYHGVTYYFFKCHLERFGLFKKILFSPLLAFSYFMERPPMKKADKIICVSERVKNELERLYGKRKSMKFIRTGVDLKKFKRQDKIKARGRLGLDKNKVYGLYVGRGGYWRKGLDRAVEISEKLYFLDKNYRLIVIGADKSKVKNLIDKEFLIYVENGEREKMPFYYGASDIFFCMSRYEGGAPTLVVSEAMASECLLVCSKDSQQEIIKNNENGLIIKYNFKEEAKKINQILGNKEQKKKIIKKSKETIKKFSLEKWGKEYLEVLLR